MDHPIDPKTDCVFKALLGAADNRDLLIHFLNAILGADLPSPVTQVDILNPYNEREFVTDKLSIVGDHPPSARMQVRLKSHLHSPVSKSPRGGQAPARSAESRAAAGGLRYACPPYEAAWPEP